MTDRGLTAEGVSTLHHVCGFKPHTPLVQGRYCAPLKADLASVRALLQADGARELVNAGDAQGCTPLHIAALTDEIAVICTLIQAGASLFAVNAMGQTPAEYAKAMGHSATAAALERAAAVHQNGVDVEMMTNQLMITVGRLSAATLNASMPKFVAHLQTLPAGDERSFLENAVKSLPDAVAIVDGISDSLDEALQVEKKKKKSKKKKSTKEKRPQGACAHCGALTRKTCDVCNDVHYCSDSCQGAHAPQHKGNCLPPLVHVSTL